MAPQLTAWNTMTGIQAYRLTETSSTDGDFAMKRRAGIGGSDIAAIMGVNPWKGPMDVFLEKTGRVTVKMNEKMKWGKILEDPVAQEYSERTGNKVQRVNAILQSTDHPVALANVDRLIVPVEEGKKNGILEVKATAWGGGWADNDVPDYYYCQFQWYGGVTRLTWGSFATLINGNDLVIPPAIDMDHKLFEDMVVQAERFWADHVQKDVPPQLGKYDSNAGVRLMYGSNAKGKTVDLPATYFPIVAERKRLNELIKKAEDEKKNIDRQILSIMKDAQYAFGGDHRVTRVVMEKAGVDGALLKELYPEIYTKVLKSNTIIYPLYK
jgi:putative phage-type endonuclease